VNAGRLKPWQHFAIFGLVVAAIVSRRPDALLNPQFYSEDGFVWFANAWNLGWLHSLTLPDGGYLNTLPRLICGIAIHIPLRSAPLLLNWFGIVIQALPVSILLTSRCAGWGPLSVRALEAASYVVLPNSSELAITITNAHWHLALVACVVLFAEAPTNRAWQVVDGVVLILVGLTGPWSLVLTPLVLVFWWFRRQPWSLAAAAILAVCALIQATELFIRASAERSAAPLGATFPVFARLIAGQIYLGALWGQNSFASSDHLAPALFILSVGTFFIVHGLLKLGLEMKLFIAFALLITAAALKSPLIAGDQPRWLLLSTDKGGRYWFFLMLALIWSLIGTAARKQSRALQILSLLCLVPMLRAIPHDWRYRPYPDSRFGCYLREFNSVAPGTRIAFPIYPYVHPMVLIKKE
jgi:hypothetical protein